MSKKFKADSKIIRKIRKMFKETVGCEIDPDGLFQAKSFYEERGYLPEIQKLPNMNMEDFKKLQDKVNTNSFKRN